MKRILLGVIAAVMLLVGGSCAVAFLQFRSHVNTLSLSKQLSQAALDGNLSDASDLISRGADVNYCDAWTPLDVAVQHEDVAMVKLLLAHGADPRLATMNGPILFTVKNDQIAALLAAHGADVNARSNDGFGNTVLMMATERGDIAMVRLLLANGADPGATNNAGRTASDLSRNATIDQMLSSARLR